MRSLLEWKRRAEFLGVELTNRTEDLVHAGRHIAEQDREIELLKEELRELACKSCTPAKKRRRGEKKGEFVEQEVPPAVARMEERADRALDLEQERARSEMEQAQRALAQVHPCA